MPLNIKSLSTEEVTVTVTPTILDSNGNQVPGGVFDAGSPVIAVQSGDSTFTQDPNAPLSFVALAGPTASQTIYTVNATAGGVALPQDTVIYDVSLAVTPATGFTLNAAPPVPKP